MNWYYMLAWLLSFAGYLAAYSSSSYKDPTYPATSQCAMGNQQVCGTNGYENFLFENQCEFNEFNGKQLRAGQWILNKTELNDCFPKKSPNPNGNTYCPQYCNNVQQPVCGSYLNVQRNFTNECEMRRYMCEQNENWQLVSNGTCVAATCGSEAQEICAIFENNMQEFESLDSLYDDIQATGKNWQIVAVGPCPCPPDYKPICAKVNCTTRTYQNECFFRKDIQNATYWSILFHGECPLLPTPCNNVQRENATSTPRPIISSSTSTSTTTTSTPRPIISSSSSTTVSTTRSTTTVTTIATTSPNTTTVSTTVSTTPSTITSTTANPGSAPPGSAPPGSAAPPPLPPLPPGSDDSDSGALGSAIALPPGAAASGSAIALPPGAAASGSAIAPPPGAAASDSAIALPPGAAASGSAIALPTGPAVSGSAISVPPGAAASDSAIALAPASGVGSSVGTATECNNTIPIIHNRPVYIVKHDKIIPYGSQNYPAKNSTYGAYSYQSKSQEGSYKSGYRSSAAIKEPYAPPSASYNEGSKTLPSSYGRSYSTVNKYNTNCTGGYNKTSKAVYSSTNNDTYNKPGESTGYGSQTPYSPERKYSPSYKKTYKTPSSECGGSYSPTSHSYETPVQAPSVYKNQETPYSSQQYATTYSESSYNKPEPVLNYEYKSESYKPAPNYQSSYGKPSPSGSYVKVPASDVLPDYSNIKQYKIIYSKTNHKTRYTSKYNKLYKYNDYDDLSYESFT